MFFDADFETIDWVGSDFDANDPADLQKFYDVMTSLYAATDEKHDEAAWAQIPPERRREGRGIEVGHIFYFGRKYSEPMGLTVAGPDGTPVVPEMGSYGVGVSRLVGAIIEASHDEAGIIWPGQRRPVPRRHPEPEAGRPGDRQHLRDVGRPAGRRRAV